MDENSLKGSPACARYLVDLREFRYTARGVAVPSGLSCIVLWQGKEVRSDARPQAQKNQRCVRWNTLRIFLAEHDAGGCRSFGAV